MQQVPTADAGRLLYELLVGKDRGGFTGVRVDPASGRIRDEARRPSACIIHQGIGEHGTATGRTGQGSAVSTNPPPPDPTPGERKKLIGVGVFLAFLLVLLLLLGLRALGLWSGGEMAWPLG